VPQAFPHCTGVTILTCTTETTKFPGFITWQCGVQGDVLVFGHCHCHLFLYCRALLCGGEGVAALCCTLAHVFEGRFLVPPKPLTLQTLNPYHYNPKPLTGFMCCRMSLSRTNGILPTRGRGSSGKKSSRKCWTLSTSLKRRVSRAFCCARVLEIHVGCWSCLSLRDM